MTPDIDTHAVLIMDATDQGVRCADELLDNCPQVKDRMSAWRASGDAFFVFVLEHQTGLVGSITAKDLDSLLSDILPDLFASHLMPPAVPGFGVASDKTLRWAIYQTIEDLRITASWTGDRH